jgi:hypothetical protein
VSQRHFIPIYTDLQNPVFGNLVRRGRQIEDLAGFSHPRFQQPRTALIADRRRCVGNSEGAVRRLLDLDHRSHIGQVEAALAALDKRLSVEVYDAA